jgi:SAM-dependent methyltransferase
MSSKFIYLIMSETGKLEYEIPQDSDYLILKWSNGAVKEPNAFNFPSTFAGGRNELAQRAKQRGKYLYYIFRDDDVQFINCNLSNFEAVLRSYEDPPPYVFPYLKAHHFYNDVKEEETYMRYADHPLMALRSDVAHSVPYSTKYDSFCWWRTVTDWSESYVDKYGVSGICLGWLKIHNGKHRDTYPIGTRGKSYDQEVLPLPNQTEKRKSVSKAWSNEEITKWAKKSKKLDDSGAWLGNGEDDHKFDPLLCDNLSKLFQKNSSETILDLGCGDGSYTHKLRSDGLKVVAVDGNPNTQDITKGAGVVANFCNPLWLGLQFDWVLSLEVGEHVPKEYEKNLLDIVSRHSRNGVVLSWAVPGQMGLGHVNCQTNEHIIREMDNRGFRYDLETSLELRKDVSWWWFMDTIMAFLRKD